LATSSASLERWTIHMANSENNGTSRGLYLQWEGKLGPNYASIADDGWSLLRFRTGNAAPENFDSVDELLATLIDES